MQRVAGVNKVTILPHLFMSLMSVSPYFITRNNTFSLSQYWFFLIFVTGGTNYIIFSHVWSFLDQFLTREAYFSNLITSVCYANHVSISTPGGRSVLGRWPNKWYWASSIVLILQKKLVYLNFLKVTTSLGTLALAFIYEKFLKVN